MIKNIKISTRLLVAFLGVGLIPFTILGITALTKSSGIISKQAFEKLETVQELKKAQVEDFIVKCRGDIMVLANNPGLIEAVKWFTASFRSDGTLNKDAYVYASQTYGAALGLFIDEYGYFDVMLISPEGKIVYSSKGGTDLGQNVVSGELKNSSLGNVFPRSMKGLAIEDFAPYAPADNEAICFILAPFYGSVQAATGKEEAQKELLAVVALKLNKDPLNTIVQRRAGMGETGGTYLVAREGNKKFFRSDLFTSGKNSMTMGKEVFLPFLDKAFAGQSASETFSQEGISQLVSYSPLKIEGLDWAMVSKIDEDEAYQQVSSLVWIITVIALICMTAILVVAFIFTRSIINPIKGVVDRIRDIAEGEGDLTSRLEVKNKDEMGELARWFNIFIDKLQMMVGNIAGNADTLNNSSSELSQLSQQMSAGAEQMSSRAEAVAAASEEMSSNMDSVAAAMDEAATKVSLVATAAEQMTSTINEIAQNSEKARNITGEAVSRSQTASAKVNELGTAAVDIGKVTETITEISEQTNLLALNATIEAARAGEAGKGFAVVANEIKELARQTAEATQEIKLRIDGIQNSTVGTVSEIEQISKVINDVNEIVSSIATAVEEQSVTTKDIAKNVSQASQGIQEVNENVSQSSTVSKEIAREITDVNQASTDMTNSSSQMNLSAEELSKLSEELKALVNKFKV